MIEVTPAPAAARVRPRVQAHIAPIVWLLLPAVFLFWLYSKSFRIWFREDDFPLLFFVRQVHSFHDFLGLLTAPYAQGTIRPWSERLPFLISWNLFGADCVPLRIAVFATAVVDIVLLAMLTRRLFGSRIAGSAAALFWAASAAIVTPMTWNSGYNEVQYQVFLLGALLLFIRFADTGQKRFWWMQAAVFVLGFGSLENNIVYPAIAAAWALIVCRKRTGGPVTQKQLLLSTIPLFAISELYYVFHMRVAPAPSTGIYAIRVDWRIAQTLWEYAHWSFVARDWVYFGLPRRLAPPALLLTMGSFAAFAAWQIRAGRTAVLFGIAWFLLTLSPMLPLPDRHTEYYLGGPVMGLAMIAGYGIALACRNGWLWRMAALIPAAAWFAGMIPSVRTATERFVEDSKLSRSIVLGAQLAVARHPGKTILIDGVSQRAYDAAIFEGGFSAFGMDNVFLTPHARETIRPNPADQGFEGMVVGPAVARHAVEYDEALVFDFSTGHLKNVTTRYARFAVSHYSDSPPPRIQIANPLYAYLLGPEWYEPKRFVRWMPGRATLHMAAPKAATDVLRITGFAWEEQLRRGPIHLSVAVNGTPLGSAEVHGPETRFDIPFPIGSAAASLQNSGIEVELTASPVAKVESRDYGFMLESVALEHTGR